MRHKSRRGHWSTSLPFLLSALVCAGAAGAQELTFYVAPDGSDAWTGTADRAAGGGNGPFKTVARARDAVRARKQRDGGTLKQPVTVVLRGGTYALAEPLVLTPQDSGSEGAPVTYTAAKGEAPVLSGGRRVTGWKQGTLSGRAVWSAKVPAGGMFRELWVDGKPAVRARQPDAGYFKIAEVPDAKPETDWTQGQTNWKFNEGELKATDDLSQAEALVFTRWVESRLPVIGLDAKDRLIRFSKRSVWKLDPGDVYYVENAPQFLDQPGEWYLDRKSSTLHYLPRPGEDMAGAEVIAPALVQVLRIEGKPEAGQYVEHVRFRGVQFSHSEWAPPPQPARPGEAERGGFSQAAIEVPGAVWAEGARHCAFEDCTVANAGNYGIELGRGCRNNRVVGCTIRDLGGGGVKLGETRMRDDEPQQAFANHVTDCTIRDGGNVWASAVGVWVGQSYDNRIAHNLIHDLHYTGISVGWTWGYGKSLARGNVIEFNHVHHIGKRQQDEMPPLSDMGGIYTLGVQPGTVIRNNVFHHLEGRKYGGWGIYLDEGSTDILVENNLVHHTTHGGFHQHYGRDNVVRNNVFAFGRTRQVERSRSEPHRSFTFERNIVLWNQGQGVMGNFDNFNLAFDRNLYWHYGAAEPLLAYRGFPQWQEQGMDKNSFVADPMFVDAEKGDFRLKPDSPALKLGFVQPDWTAVGPRDPARRGG